MEGINSVATCVMVETGSRHETPEINGVSHFLEHMVFKGTEKYPTTEDVNFIERMGGLQNAYTDVDVTNFHNKVMANDWKEALELNKEFALHPLLLQKHIDRERDVILEEMKRYNDENSLRIGEEFQMLLYKGTPLGMRVIGTEKSLRAATAKTLQDYRDRMYTPERIVVVVAGQLRENERSEVRKQTEEWFGRETEDGRRKTEDREQKPEKQLRSPIVDAWFGCAHHRQDRPGSVVITKKDAEQAHITLGVRTFARGSEDRFAWSVFNILFGVSFTSRLFKEIREKRGLCYTVRSGSENWDDVGNWSIYAGVATNKVEEAIKAILFEIQKAKEEGISEEEIAIAKKRILTMISFKTEDPEFMAEYYGQQELRHLPILTIDDYFRKITAVTKKDIDRLVRKYFVQNTLNLAVVWNKPKDNNIESLLKI